MLTGVTCMITRDSVIPRGCSRCFAYQFSLQQALAWLHYYTLTYQQLLPWFQIGAMYT